MVKDRHSDDTYVPPMTKQVKIAEVYPIQSTKPHHPLPSTVGAGNKSRSPLANSSKLSLPEMKEEEVMCSRCAQVIDADYGIFPRHFCRPPSEPVNPTVSGINAVEPHCMRCMEGFQNISDWRLHVSSMHMMRSCSCKTCNIGFTHSGNKPFVIILVFLLWYYF